VSLLRRSNGKYASIATRRPLARADELVVEELDGDLLIYDHKSQRAHCLSGPAARVWRACDGTADADALATSLEMSAESVTQAFDELEAAGLLEQGLQILSGNGNGNGNGHGITRRELTKRSAQIGTAVVAAPLVLSITAPTAWATATPIPFFCNIYTTQDCGASTGCGAIAGCCCCSKGCAGQGSCKGCTSVSACTSGQQLCADPANNNDLAGTDCSDAKGTQPFSKCGCCGPGFFPNNISQGSAYCGCGFGPQTDVDSTGVPTDGYQQGTSTTTKKPGSGCCDITSTGPDPNGPAGNRFVKCTNAHTCVPCCNGKPIYPSASSEFGCCGGSISPGVDSCNHTAPVGYIPASGTIC